MKSPKPTTSSAATLALLTLCSITTQSAEAKKSINSNQRPNIIIINADDLGSGDPSCYGGTLFETPNIDHLAAEGIKCTNGYVSAPVSGVSRVGLLTGSYQQRYGMQWNQDQWATPGRKDPLLPASHRQIQTAFKEAGYVTAMAGKIGFNDSQPFDNYYSFTFNGCNYFPNEEGKYANVDVQPGDKKIPVVKTGMWGPEREGGIRIPYIISWPKELAQGETYTNMVSTLDLYPTLCSAARVAIPEETNLDGVDLMPYFTGGYDDRAPHKHLFWFANRMGAVRMGKWKMLIDEDQHYLFDLESDEGETKNVMKENPEVMHEILSAYFDFRNQMPAYRNPFIRPIDVRSKEVLGLPTLDPK